MCPAYARNGWVREEVGVVVAQSTACGRSRSPFSSNWQLLKFFNVGVQTQTLQSIAMLPGSLKELGTAPSGGALRDCAAAGSSGPIHRGVSLLISGRRGPGLPAPTAVVGCLGSDPQGAALLRRGPQPPDLCEGEVS